jgi:hypothetical protein
MYVLGCASLKIHVPVLSRGACNYNAFIPVISHICRRGHVDQKKNVEETGNSNGLADLT